jgi:hypothetical protein
MKTKKWSNTINTIHVVSKKDKVYMKDHLKTDTWYPINFQWIPLVRLQQNIKIS